MIDFRKRVRDIGLLRVGEGLASELVHGLARDLEAVFRASCRILPGALEARFAHSAHRGQYHSTAILARLAEMPHQGDSRLLGITEYDLFVPVLTYVFGEGQVEGHCAVVSLHRLREEFYGLPGREDILRERLLKEAIHELGHTYGLRHCPDWRCVMASTHAVERLDLKEPAFCADCRRIVVRG